MNKTPLKPAKLWSKIAASDDDSGVKCLLCEQKCRIASGRSGSCGVRTNVDGELMTAVGDNIAALNLDPVEKKPLFHFLPGTVTLSLGTMGCNFHCAFCQNSSISQVSHDTVNRGTTASPGDLVVRALKSGAKSLSYTYNEPTVFFELISDTAVFAREAGLYNVMVSNAYMSEDCFDGLNGLIDAANFDLKSFDDGFYRKLCKGRLDPVLRNIKAAVKAGWWVELTTLVISGVNDGEDELDALARWIHDEAGPEVPWHVSRFRPAYRMTNQPVTAVESLERALAAGDKHGLKYVYVGNLPGHESESTFCPSCGRVALKRVGYSVEQEGFDGKCPHCGAKIAGLWG